MLTTLMIGCSEKCCDENMRVSDAIVIYKATQYRHEESEVVIRYNDLWLNLQLPEQIIVSNKDKNGIPLRDAPQIRI